MNNIKKLLISITFHSFLLFNTINCLAENTRFEINGDSSTIDLPNKIMIYKGHTSFKTNEISITGDELVVFKKDDVNQNIELKGSPVKLLQNSLTLKQNTELSANNIEYDLNNKNIIANDNIVLIQTTMNNENNQNQQYFKVLGDHLNFLSEPEGTIKITGSPLQITIRQDQQEQLTATAKEMLYNQITQAFELSGDIFLTTDRNTIKAEKIFYDGKIIHIPESPNQPVQMTQTIKDTHE